MSSQHHIIGRTLLEINTGRLADVLSLQEEVSLVFQRQALPAMERLFDQLVGAEEVVRLDRMVVDVGTVSPQLFADEFVRQLLEGLNQVLGDRLAGHLPINTDIEIITQDRAGADWEVLLFFLQYGRMPWWVSVSDWQDWLTRWKTVMGEGTVWRSPLHKLLATQRASQQRLIDQFPEDFRHQLVLQLQPAWTNWPTLLKQARQLLQTLALPSNRVKVLEKQAWQLLLTEMSPTPTPASPLPTATWINSWLAQLVEIGQLAVSPNSEISLSTFEPNPAEPFSSEIDRTSGVNPSDLADPQLPSRRSHSQETSSQGSRQQLRILLEAFPTAERAVWLKTLDRVWPVPGNAAVSPATGQSSNSSVRKGKRRKQQKTGYPLELDRADATVQRPTSKPIEGKTTANSSTRSIKQQEQPDVPTQKHNSDSESRTSQISSVSTGTRYQQRKTSSAPGIDEANTTAQHSTSPLTERERSANSLDLSPEQPDQTAAPARGHSSDPESRISQIVQTEYEQIRDNTVRESSDRINSPEPSTSSLNNPNLGTELLEPNIQSSRPPRKPSDSSLSPEEEASGLFVTQAGLVLLHPFLHIYFDEIGLLEGESFRDELAQQTAVYLLYYLATKQTDALEYELVLPKLLCSWPLNEPVARGLDFPKAALAEGEHLLQTAIDHWQALKSTSPDGLREGFLQRDGKLTRTDSGWKLRVEQKAIDILLSRLPWGVSMVTLPWMDELLTVEWT